MFKKYLLTILTAAAFAPFSSAFAATDINKATQAELESVRGIGTSMSTKILDERKKSNYKNWDDFISRVGGVGPGNASKFSADGLTVNGEPFNAANAQPFKKAPKPQAQPKPSKDKPANS
jgi:competence protein ComEA